MVELGTATQDMSCLRRTAARSLYTLVLFMLLPFIFIKLLWRARLQPEYLQHVGERFGFYKVRSERPVIWLHAVSVGETRATVSLVNQLRHHYPQHQILLTHTTPTGRATSEQLYADNVIRVYLPYDYPFAVRRFLRHFQPELGMLMETEIWFNLIHSCKREQIPLLLLNARMSEKSSIGYGRFNTLTREALQSLCAVAAQTETDAQRLLTLGARQVRVMGNLKFDIVPPRVMQELGRVLRERFGEHRKVFLAASTREGEEALLLNAWKATDTLLVIVPRHPQRFSEVAELINKHGLMMQRRSQSEAVPLDVQVVLGDSMGEMFAYYIASDLAFIGGSLLPFGGQNLIEACAVGTPVLIGMHTYNFADATRLAVEAGAAQRVKDAQQLVALQQSLLHDVAAMQEMRRQDLAFVASHQGATDKAMELIALHLAVE